MAFNLQYFAQMATGQSASFAINFTSQSATPYGAANAFSYNGIASEDTLSSVAASDYFLPVVSQLQLGDFIMAACTDASAVFYVSTITYPDNDGKGASVTIIGDVEAGVVGVANGGTGRTSLPVAATPSSYAAWDANSNLHSNNILYGTQIITGSLTDVVLTAASPKNTYIVGDAPQIIFLPDTRTLEIGATFFVYNNQTSFFIDIYANTGDELELVTLGSFASFTVINNLVDSAASWDSNYTISTLPQFTICANPAGGTFSPRATEIDTQSLQFTIDTKLAVLTATNGGINAGGAYGAGLQVNAALAAQTVPFQIFSPSFTALHTTPYLIPLPAPIPLGQAIFLDSVVFFASIATTPYTGGGNLVVQYGSTPGGVPASAPIPAATITGLSLTDDEFFAAPGVYAALSTTPVNTLLIKDKQLYLYVDTADFTGGDMSFGVVINYHIVNL